MRTRNLGRIRVSDSRFVCFGYRKVSEALTNVQLFSHLGIESGFSEIVSKKASRMKPTKFARTLAFGVTIFAVGGCLETGGSTTAVSAPAPGSVPADSLEGQARTACLSAVRTTTANPDVSVIRSSFAEAGTEVILRVGETGTWRCIGYRDGSTAGVMSITDEGAL